VKSIYADGYRALMRRLRAERKRRGITQTEVARAMALTQPTVALLEAAQRRMDVLQFAAYCRAVGVSPARAIRWLDLPDAAQISPRPAAPPATSRRKPKKSR
jgi:transcriptional regulator with XRE-family HTH domain